MRTRETARRPLATLEELSARIQELEEGQRALRQRNEELLKERVEVEARLQTALAEARRGEEETRWLLQGAEAVLECRTFEEAARRIFDAARAVTGAVSGYVALLSDDGAENELLFLEAGGLPCYVDPSLPMPIRGLRAVAYAEAKVVYDNDFANSEWVRFMPPGHVEMRNVLFAPLSIDERVVGVIGLANKPTDFTAADVRITRAFGDMAAIALRRVWGEEALRESEERYRGLVERSLQGVVIAQANPVRIAFASQPMEAITGFSPEELMSLSPQEIADLIHPQHREAFFGNFQARLRGEGVPPQRDYQIIHRDGRVRWVEIYSSRIEHEGEPATQTVFLDVTTRKASEAKLQEYAHLLEEMVEQKVHELEQERAKIVQMDKMAAVGQLATGVAHELNQPLTAITFEADFLRQMAQRARDEGCALGDVLTPDQLDQVGADLLGDLARCRRIIDHVREFSRLSRGRPRATDVNQVIEDSFILLRERLRNHGVDVRFELQEGLPLIMVDPHRLEQVFLNLISNAEHALEQQAAANVALDYRKVLHIATASLDGRVVVTIRDNGCGIPAHVQKWIFDPFFTTKPVGEGTGLGLSISYGIVTEYGGEITCRSQEGEGTLFTLMFPVVEGGG